MKVNRNDDKFVIDQTFKMHVTKKRFQKEEQKSFLSYLHERKSPLHAIEQIQCYCARKKTFQL